jgi:hypothetical protein
MNRSSLLAEIERQVHQLPPAVRLRLIEIVVHSLRQGPAGVSPPLQDELAKMAADPEVQRELRQIVEEFGPAEMDGLEDA